ncbi:hypothetical protein C3E78_02725 [Aeromicrobium chenweiae]|uniref:Uncharacterized protein n=1 Tax=Aeromicrobium chenweiae TaxID=2079793 RepID=A0A2S0WIQ0_9ACTN|nr:hypothetical protein C3E78_02725 [Aeromicrobium chenweiae]
MGGTAYDVVPGGDDREALLLADGSEVDRRTTGFLGRGQLSHGGTTFEVQWGPRSTITAVHRLEPAGNEKGSPRRTPLVPPPGSRAARREALAREHPTLFVLRRVAQALGEILLGAVGVGALLAAFFGGLLPRLDLSWLPSPDLPAIEPPRWLRQLDPFAWLGRLGLSWPDLPGWLDAVLAQQRYWLPVVIAVVVALRELDRRRQKDADRDAARDAGRPEDGPED